MKIGILTYHYVPNFGAQLQTLSTVGYLQNHGLSPIVLHYQPYELDNIYKTGRVSEEQCICQEQFAQKAMPLSNICRNEKELVKEIERLQLDAIIVGSDALFKYVPIKMRNILRMGRRRPHINHIHVPVVEKLQGNPFFGGFVRSLSRKIPIYAYAVSSQNCPFYQMTIFEKIYMRRCIENFRILSVRDLWTKRMVETIIMNNTVSISPDPVFAFNQNVKGMTLTKNEVLAKYGLQDKYVLLSFWHSYDVNYIQELSSELKKHCLQPVALAMPEGLQSFGVEKTIDIPIEPLDWYSLIINSAGYIGERMHPILVCLHNAVPFFSFDEYGVKYDSRIIFPKQRKGDIASSKTYHILHAAGLENNMYSIQYSSSAIISTKQVVEHLLTFDKGKCAEFAEEQLKLYNNEMQKIIDDVLSTAIR